LLYILSLYLTYVYLILLRNSLVLLRIVKERNFMLANTKEIAKAAANYRAMHPILRREIAEYSRGMASAYALEQTTRRRWYQFTCSSTHPVSGPIYSVSQKADCNVKRKESRERESQETCEGKDGGKARYHFPRFPGTQENRPDTKYMQWRVTSMYLS